MSHLDFVRPSGQWSGEMVPCSADYERLDAAQARIINGDGGGTWNPSSPIIIGGSGVTFTTAFTAFDGGVTTKTGGRIKLANVANNVPTISSAQGDTILISVADMIAPFGDLVVGHSWLPDDYVSMSTAPFAVGAQAAQSSSTGTQAAFLPIPRRYLHKGASFSKLKLHFRVPTKPTTNSLPSLAFAPWAYQPSTQTTYAMAPVFNNWLATTAYTAGSYVVPQASGPNYINGYYYKCTVSGTTGGAATVFNGQTTIGNTFTDGSVTWQVTGLAGELSQVNLDAATYYNNGQPQTLEFDFDNATGALLAQNAIDHSAYSYGILLAALGDASQIVANVNIVLHSVEIVLSNIVDLRFT